MHSTREFLLSDNWLDALSASMAGRVLFKRRAAAAVSQRERQVIIHDLLRSSAEARLDGVTGLVARPGGASLQSVQGFIERLNKEIGTAFRHNHGYRTHALLVISGDYPWASFFSPTSDGRRYFTKLLSDIFRESASPVDQQIRIAAILLSIVIGHPFVDCNGRTVRLVAYALLRSWGGLSDECAYEYANLFSGKCAAFVLACWEIRESGSYQSYLALLE